MELGKKSCLSPPVTAFNQTNYWKDPTCNSNIMQNNPFLINRESRNTAMNSFLCQNNSESDIYSLGLYQLNSEPISAAETQQIFIPDFIDYQKMGLSKAKGSINKEAPASIPGCSHWNVQNNVQEHYSFSSPYNTMCNKWFSKEDHLFTDQRKGLLNELGDFISESSKSGTNKSVCGESPFAPNMDLSCVSDSQVNQKEFNNFYFNQSAEKCLGQERYSEFSSTSRENESSTGNSIQ